MHGRKLVTTGTIATFAILALVGGCREATTGPTSVKPQDFASNLKLLSGNQQLGVVGAALPEQLTVKVVDAGGQPVSGATVLWQVRDGGGTINPPASTTGASGVASVTWTLGTGLVANKAVAVLSGSYVLDSAVFTASSREGPPASMVMTSGAALQARVAALVSSPLSVVLKDQYGHPVPKVKVTWLPLTAQSGTVTAVNDSTDASGSSTANWTTGTLAATQVAAARIAGLNDVIFTVNATADTSRRLTLISGNNQNTARGLPLTTPLVVRLADRFGNFIEGDTIIWNDSIGGGGSITPTRGATDVNGLAQATWTLGATIGSQAVRARVAQSRVTFAATARVGLPKTITSAGNNQAQRVVTTLATPLSVQVKDSLGQAVPGLVVTWSTVNPGGSVAKQTDTTVADGSATALWTLGTVVGAQTASLTIAGVASPLTFSATASADTSRRLTLVSGGAQTAGVGGALSSISMRLLDRFNNPIVGDSIFFSDSTVGGGSFSASAAATDATGLASVTWTLGPRVGAQSFRSRLAAPRPEKVTVTATATVQLSDVVTGNFHSCAIANGSKIYCWGLNDVGQLGRGTNKSTNAPTTPVALALDTTADAQTLFARSVTGSRSSVCAVTPSNQVYCWGKGWGSLATSSLPIATSVNAAGGSGTALGLTDFLVAEDHACLIQTSGISNCTGNNDHGQLGDESAGPPYTSPGNGTWPWVNSQKTFSVIRLGTSFTCGFHRYLSEGVGAVPDSSQVPLCWGDGTEGQRGDSSTLNNIVAPKNSSVPLHIKVRSVGTALLLASFDSLSLAVGDKHACAVIAANSAAGTAGDAYCWGLNAYGQLGRATAGSGNAARDSVAGKVVGGVSFARLYAGKYHTCGLDATGNAYCWGRNDSGQLGNGLQTTTSTPQAVLGGLTFRTLSVGELTTCGVTGTPGQSATAASRVYCWGDNTFGQVGNSPAAGASTMVLTPARVAGQNP